MNDFQEKLKLKINVFVTGAYRVSKKFPKDELFGITSQLRRAAISIMLNYVEGYARRKPLVRLNFLETSYGSLQECSYILNFSSREGYCAQAETASLLAITNEIGAMLWSEITHLSNAH